MEAQIIRSVFDPTPLAVEISIEGPGGVLPVQSWSLDAPDALLPGVDLAHRLLATDKAIADTDRILVEHQTVAALSSREAASIGLPPQTEFVAQLQTAGLVTHPTFGVELKWLRPNGQAVVGAERLGAFLKAGEERRRIPEPLFSLAEAVEEINGSVGSSDPGARLASLAKLKEILPDAAAEGHATTSGLLQNMTIAVADAFSLDMESDQLVPILHGSRRGNEGPLLAPDSQADFAKRHFGAFAGVRSAYGLGNGSYVVLTPPLRRALTEVRKAQAAPIARRRALFASPRAFLQTALGQDEGDTAIEFSSGRRQAMQNECWAWACGSRVSYRGSSFREPTGLRRRVDRKNRGSIAPRPSLPGSWLGTAPFP